MIHKTSSIAAITIATLLLVTPLSSRAQNAPLVESAKVLSWHRGASHIIHCQVQTPYVYQLSSQSSARLNWLLPEGTTVTKGQLIATQDSFYLEREIERLKLDIQGAMSQQKYLDAELTRLEALKSQQAVSASQLNDMIRQSRQAKISKTMLQEQLKEAEYRYQLLEHTAPTHGQILSLQSQPGEYLSQGQNILRLQPLEEKELLCELPLNKYLESNKLNNAQFSSKKGSFVLKRQSQYLQNESQTLQLYLTASKEDQELFIGERLQITINSQAAEVTRVPHDALELADNGYYVWRIDEENMVSRLPVTIVSTQNEFFLVKSELNVNDIVVTIGKQGLSEQQQVTLNTSKIGQGVSS